MTALENQVVFSAGDVVLSSRLVEGRFPNYQQLLPEAYEHELRIERGELVEVVRRISLLAQKNAPLRLAFTEGALEVSAQTPGRRRGARSRCRFRSRANHWRSGSTRSSSATASRAPRPRSSCSS